MSGAWVECGHTPVNDGHMDCAGVLTEAPGTPGSSLVWRPRHLPICGGLEAASFSQCIGQFGF